MTHLVWLKRDFRIFDHAPLYEANQAALRYNQQLLILYVIESSYWSLPEQSFRHWEFIRDSLKDLQNHLRQLYGHNLLVLQGDTLEAFVALHNQVEITTVYSHEETGIDWTYKRDLRMAKLLKKLNISWKEYPNGGVIRRLNNRDHWKSMQQKRMMDPCLPAPSRLAPPPEIPFRNVAIEQFSLPRQNEFVVQRGGRILGQKCLDSFLTSRARYYQKSISKPAAARDHCSRISPHLSFGTLSVREVLKATWTAMREAKNINDWLMQKNLASFQSRLHWHCHFIQKLEDQPQIEFHCMHSAFEGMREPHHNEEKLQRWISGKTGFPFVDACIRSLTQTGYLNFRMRAMIVSFAAYHLFLDWRKINPLLAALFTDYEPGIHISQLQMQSGVTGINALRIYNPIKQGIEHDPDGNFIREFVPELAHLAKEEIHLPSKKYLEPISNLKVDLAFAKSEISKVRHTCGFKNEAKTVYKRLGSRKKKQKVSTNNQPSLLTIKQVLAKK